MLIDSKYIIGITIAIPDITHHPVLYVKHDVSETGVCLRLKLKPTRLGTTVRTNMSLGETVSETLCFK